MTTSVAWDLNQHSVSTVNSLHIKRAGSHNKASYCASMLLQSRRRDIISALKIYKAWGYYDDVVLRGGWYLLLFCGRKNNRRERIYMPSTLHFFAINCMFMSSDNCCNMRVQYALGKMGLLKWLQCSTLPTYTCVIIYGLRMIIYLSCKSHRTGTICSINVIIIQTRSLSLKETSGANSQFRSCTKVN